MEIVKTVYAKTIMFLINWKVTIMNNKLTDNEIIKALTICSTKGASCKDCPAFVKVDRSNCKKVLLGAIDIINRLQATIDSFTDIGKLYSEIKAEAYKKCIEKVKEYIDTHEHLTCEECECVPISKNGLDNLLKELVGEDK